jgi:type II secretory pathway pseudopilin PulG
MKPSPYQSLQDSHQRRAFSKVGRLLVASLVLCLSPKALLANAAPPKNELVPTSGLVFHEAHYDGKLTDEEARFTAEFTAESLDSVEARQLLLEGEVALVPAKLPAALRVEREGNQYRLVATKRGQYQVKLEWVAKVTRVEPWNQVSFRGPAAAIASVSAQGKDMEMQLLSGTVLESTRTNGLAQVKGFLDADQKVSLRWSGAGGTAEVSRPAVVTAETATTAQITPTVVKHVTQLRYEVLQGKLNRLRIALPSGQALTRLTGEQIRDWQAGGAVGQDTQILTVEFIKPVEKDYQLTLYSEQTVETLPATVSVNPPQPLDVERESGSLTVSADETLAELDSAAGLWQVNAPTGALAAYRFNGRPANLNLKLKRVEPVIKVAERVTARLEETRLLTTHALAVEVEKAGIYTLDLLPPPGQAVADVRGEGVEDWKLTDGGKILRVSFSSKVLGARKLEVQLEQPLKLFPEQITIAPLQVTGVTNQTTMIGAASAPGIQLKTAELGGLREMPVGQLPGHTDELLAYKAEQADWKLSLATERLAARVVAEIFNLATIGDGLVGGSATLRYGLLNQGVQEFRVTVPAVWKNVEFTGPNIRRKEMQPDGSWLIRLQDKVWSGYTLVVTYDYQFDPKGSTLVVGGIHAAGVERENGSVALTTAASLQLKAKTVSDSLRRVDEADLAAADRALITRAVALAYQYSGDHYDLAVEATRFEDLPVLSAVADRTQLTTVLTESGEMLTEASFMVKNNDKQFQRFKLPAGAKFWSCHVNNQPVKVEQDNTWLLVPLPRGANRDQAFAVDMVYAEKKVLTSALFPHGFQLQAPHTDVPNTYAEWQLYAPPTLRLSGFSGNMTVARGTTYDLRDAWDKLIGCYEEVARAAGAELVIMGVLVLLTVALVGSAVRRGWNGVFAVLGVFCIIALLAAMLLPALSKAKARSQRISAISNLKQIGLAMKTFALDNGDRYPMSYGEMTNELSTEEVLVDPATGLQFAYLGGGLSESEITPDSVVAYSPTDVNGLRPVLLADGSVQQVNNERFAELSRRGFIVRVTPAQAAQNQQIAAVRAAQLPAAAVAQNGSSALQPAPAAVGLRSIRIEIPRTGQLFTFTKVLNVGDEALSVRVKLMKLQTFQMGQMALQLAGLITGLLVWWWQWRKRNSFLLTVALALALASVADLLLAWRLLHVGLIIAAPVLLLAVVAWLTWKYWPRRPPAIEPAPSRMAPSIPPAVAAWTILFVIAQATPAEASSIQNAPRPTPASVSILSASYDGTVNDRVAQIEATLQVSTEQPGQRIELFGEDIVVQEFSARPAQARLLREGNAFSVLLGRRGQTTLQFKLLAKLGGDVTKRQLSFAVPPALASQLTLSIDQPDTEVEFPAAIAFKRETKGQQTRLQALLGAVGRVELLWTPRVKRAAEIAAM